MNGHIRPTDVNRADLPVPLYEHVKRQISEAILMGALPEGTVLPSEAVLAARHGVAVGTMRHALADLATEGLLSRRRRTGTVVTGRAPQHSLRFLFQYFRLHTADGAMVRSDTRVIGLARGPATPQEAAALTLAQGGVVIRIDRLRRIGGRVVMLDHLVLPADRLPGFPTSRKAVPDLLYLHLLQAYGLRVTAVRESLTADLATANERKALDLPRPAAVLRIATLAYDAAGQPVLMGRHAASTTGFAYVNEVR